MIGLFYSYWSYWIRQSQSDKTVFALGRSPSVMSAENSRRRECRKQSRSRWWRNPLITEYFSDTFNYYRSPSVDPSLPCFDVVDDGDGSLVNISRLPPSQFATGHYPVREVIFDTGSHSKI